MSERRPAGRPALAFRPGFHSCGCGTRGPSPGFVGRGPRVQCERLARLGNTSPPVTGCRHSGSCASASEDTEGRSLPETGAGLCFVPSAVTQPQHGGPLLPQVPLGDPKSFRQSQQSLGKDCCWLSPGRLLGFPKGNCAIPQGNSGLLKPCSPPLVSLIPVTIHSVGQVPGLRATLGSSLSLTCTSFSPTMALFKVYWEDICFSPSPQSPCLTTTPTGPSYPHTCSPVIHSFHRCQERFSPSVYCSATNI